MSDLRDQVEELVRSMEVPLFGTRDNLRDAIQYAYMVIESLTPDQRAGAYTVLHVVLNSVAQELRRLVEIDKQSEEDVDG
jgi:hypothetical protein